MANNNKKRIQILTTSEANELYHRPVFDHAEREEYFALDEAILRTINKMGKLENKLYLILLIGYYRAKPVVAKFRLSDIKVDVKFLCKTYFPHEKTKYTTPIKSTRANLVNKMLSILGHSRLKKGSETQLVNRLRDVATICNDPRYIFDECLAFFGQQQIALPGYTSLQDLITTVLSDERSRTETILSKHMTDITRQRLRNILKTKGVLNSLSAYRGSTKGFSPSEIDQEIKTHEAIIDVYPEIKKLLTNLQLSQGNLSYYASIIHHQSIYKVRRYPEWQGMLYLVCYLFFRYRETNDKLVTCFMYLTRKHEEAAKAAAKQCTADSLELIRGKLKYAGNILNYFVDDAIPDSTTFGEVREAALELISKNDIHMISQHLTDNDFDQGEYQWQYTDKHRRKVSNSLRKLFLAINIECEPEQVVLGKQLASAREELRVEGKINTIDQRIIYKNDRPYLIEEGKVNSKRFEFYLYKRVFKMLGNNRIYVNESAENKRLDDDLISSAVWTNKDELIQKTGLPKLRVPIAETLSDYGDQLQQRMQQVSNGINTGMNEFVRRTPNDGELAWTLANRRWKEDIENPIYTQLKHMSIVEILNYVNQKTGFLEAFRRVSTRKHNVKANDEDLLAVIFANGSNQGLHRMSNASDRTIGSLRSVNDGYVHPESTGKANDLVANEIARMPVFKYYTINDASPFGSIDGQKFACRINTFKARFSAKYFQKGKGVSAMTLVSNHVPLKTSVISPNEYEAHYAFDLLYNNSSEIKPMTLTTDNHGVNNVNFALLDLFGYQFAPRYAKFKNAFYGQFEIIQGDEISIQLKNPINTKLIEQEWDEIQRIICSLSRKTTTQSTVIKKLSNNNRNNRTLAALHEYDRLVKCLYMLDYVDNKTLRQFVQQALNRGEAYHQLRRAIGSINGNQFQGGSDYQVTQWNDCARLIANCIIYYNCALLSGLIDKFEKRNDQKTIEMLSNLSPVAWRHIQLAGHYTFGGKRAGIDLDQLLEDVDPSTVYRKEVLAA